jgi:hypothetical protein
MGAAAENSATGNPSNYTDEISANSYNIFYLGTAQPGHFVARTWGGGGTSVPFTKKGDSAVTQGDGMTNTPYASPIAGNLQTPNGPDNSLYLAPLGLVEASTVTVRGRFRGLYQICHASSGFSDGQTFSGGGDYAGKTFQVIKAGPNGGFWALETSATVETN